MEALLAEASPDLTIAEASPNLTIEMGMGGRQTGRQTPHTHKHIHTALEWKLSNLLLLSQSLIRLHVRLDLLGQPMILA